MPCGASLKVGSHRTARAVLKPRRVKAKPCGRAARGLDPNTTDGLPTKRQPLRKEGCPRAGAQPECASTQNFPFHREPVFFIPRQALDAYSKNALTYDGCTSGAIIYTYVGGNPLSNIDPNGLLSLSDVAGAVSDATGGCSSNSFGDDVVNNFVDVQDSTSLLKTGTSLALGGAFAKQYGGLTFGGAAMGLVKEMRSGYTVTGIGSRTFLQAAATAGATWAANSVLIKGSYDAGVLAGSILRTGINRAASSAACTCQK